MLLLFLAACTHAPQTDSYGEKRGTVHFPVSCNQAAGRLMERGIALLHHMTYGDARKTFQAATEADADCAMGYWGVALTLTQPLWPPIPDEATLRHGWEMIEQAQSRGEKTEREQAYIGALEAYYRDGWNRDEASRLASFDQAWEKVHRQFPDDLEAACFYALAHIAAAPPGDKSYQNQERAGAIAEDVLAAVPDHPGAHHYIIHAYDYPGLAERALAVARNYGKVAPEIPHALHMPTHIFTRLGLWQESIDWNIRSADAARKANSSMHFLHALDYLAYAYLQRAQDQKAQEVLDRAMSLEGPFDPINRAAGAYTLAAVPARLALERQQWADAAGLEPRQPSSYPWNDKLAPYEAITHFARALGAGHTGDFPAARQSTEKLSALHDSVVQTNAYWAGQIEIQRTAAQAWLAHEEKKQVEALKLMRHAAELEAATHKHPVTPGEVLPARELLADLLLALDRPQDALAEYRISLERSPDRFNSLYGAGHAAELAGERQKAAAFYQKLVEVCAQADTERPRLRHAKEFLASN